MSAAARARANRHGILWMVVAMSAFIANDAIVKAVGARLPAAQIIVVRGVMAIALIAMVAQRMGALGRIRENFRGWVLLRAGCEGLGTFAYLAGLFHLPLANVSAINLSSPLFVAVMAVMFLNERVDVGRWMAIIIGFAGVLLVVQPRADDFNVFAWLCVAATLIYAFRDLLTRKLPASTPSILVTLVTATVVWAMAAVVLGATGWTAMAWRDVGLLAIGSVFLSTGYFSIIAAMRQGEISVVAPFRYISLLWALIIGFVVWGDVPNLVAWSGIGLLVGAGFYMVRKQRDTSG
jgi:drug/metabolite transporter (DMT)-like permease